MNAPLKLGDTYSSTVKATVAADVDVLIAGGGTAGVVAAIAAARAGARTLLVERSGRLGGMMTAGNAGLTKYIVHDKRQSHHRDIVARLREDPGSVQVVGGIPMEITQRLVDAGAGLATGGHAGSYVFTAAEDFNYLLLTMMEESGVELLLHSPIVDVISDESALRGVVVENKSGRQALLARIVIDATGDGDVAARAGAPFIVGVGPDDPSVSIGLEPGSMAMMGVMFRAGNVDLERMFAHLKDNREQFNVQGCALMGLDDACECHRNGEMMTINVRTPNRGIQIYNTPLAGVVTLCCPCYTGNGLDVGDLTRGQIALVKEVRAFLQDLKEHIPGFEEAFLMDTPEIGVRETRHIQGEYLLTVYDLLDQRTFPDSIGRGSHPIDVGPVPEELKDRPMENWFFSMPYRCLVPKQIDNLLVAGRCISATHEAFGCTRPTVQCMITGQAAGVAAALCAADAVAPRDLDTERLRERLAADGVLL
ncbi:MAG: FAD-dependent oxidoreductase [Candidatus Hydrogenedentes bacterium]|nr:FAD-dependent oxidoreductase [Candidatus Hydrogenedentota bacterium]